LGVIETPIIAHDALETRMVSSARRLAERTVSGELREKRRREIALRALGRSAQRQQRAYARVSQVQAPPEQEPDVDAEQVVREQRAAHA